MALSYTHVDDVLGVVPEVGRNAEVHEHVVAEAKAPELDEQLEPVERLVWLPARLFAKHWPTAELSNGAQERLISKFLNMALSRKANEKVRLIDFPCYLEWKKCHTVFAATRALLTLTRVHATFVEVAHFSDYRRVLCGWRALN